MDKQAVEAWYTGKALAAVRAEVWPALEAAQAQGYWQPGASRRVRSLLSKQSVAARFAKAQDRNFNDHRQRIGRLVDISDNRELRAKASGWSLVHAMQFGAFGDAPRCLPLVAALEPYCANDEERDALATARRWAEAFVPVADLVTALDARRPQPTFKAGELSPTQRQELACALGIDLATFEVPEIVYVYKRRVIKGVEVELPVAEIRWPEGTRHNASRFALGEQCHACGHGIRSGDWIPLLARSEQGPLSLWVGRACARKLFGLVVKGDLALEPGQAPA